jgi:nucleotide-binding universal stress UspA family protein
MTRVIVPLDRSALSEQAVPMGVFLAKALGVTLELVHVIEKPITEDGPEVRMYPSPDLVRKELESVIDRHQITSPVSVNVITGDPVQRLLQIGERDPNSILVMATHGRSGVVRTLLGSVADKVMRGASSPVLLVRPTTDIPSPPTINTITVALDGSAFAERALPWAVQLARESGATIHLVRSVESLWPLAYPTTPYDGVSIDPETIDRLTLEFTAEATSYLEEAAKRLTNEGVNVTWKVTHGRPADEIINETERAGAGMIITTTHGRGGLSRVFQGSVATALATQSKVPLFVVPASMIGMPDELRYEPETVFTL